MKQFFTLAIAAALSISAVAVTPNHIGKKTTAGLKAELREAQATQARRAAAPVVKNADRQRISIKDADTSKTTLRRAVKKGVKPMAKIVTEVLFDESFACLSAGSIEEPVMIETDEYHNIPEEVIGEDNYGFGGYELAEADGALYIYFADEDGFMWTPDLIADGEVTVEFDVMIPSGEGDQVDIIACDSWGGFDFTAEDIYDAEWHHMSGTFDVSTPEIAGTTIYFQVYAWYSEDIVIKNFVISQTTDALKAPVAYEAEECDGHSFVASWSNVSAAEGYLLICAAYDPVNYEMIEPFLMDGEPVEGTSYHFENLEVGYGYVYAVIAYDEEGELSAMSNMIQVEVLPVVENIKATITDGTAISITCDPINNASGYAGEIVKIDNYTAETEIDVVNGDFSDIESEGTLDDPEIPEDLQIQLDNMPGWYCTLPLYADGCIGALSDELFAAWFGIYGGFESGFYDFTQFVDSQATLCIEAASPLGCYVEVVLYDYDDEEETYSYVDIFDIDDLTADFKTYEIPFTLDSKYANFGIYCLDNEDGELVPAFFKNITLKATVKPGAQLESTLMIFDSEEPAFETTVEASPISTYKVRMQAYTLDEDEEISLTGIVSDYVDFTEASGVENIGVEASENAPAVFYNLQGIRVSNPADGGVYIRRQGNTTTKVRL